MQHKVSLCDLEVIAVMHIRLLKTACTRLTHKTMPNAATGLNLHRHQDQGMQMELLNPIPEKRFALVGSTSPTPTSCKSSSQCFGTQLVESQMSHTCACVRNNKAWCMSRAQTKRVARLPLIRNAKWHICHETYTGVTCSKPVSLHKLISAGYILQPRGRRRLISCPAACFWEVVASCRQAMRQLHLDRCIS